jgi:membrane-bound serine protease (ClpP class)
MRFSRAFLVALTTVAVALLVTSAAAAAPPRVLAIEFENDVNPVTADYFTRKLDRAHEEDFDAAVILLDTPGGLAESMRDIYKKELALADLPVIVYVSPPGARAASAGVWIGQAADVLAMAPGTNIGSSTPINVGGEDIQKDLRRKVVNDAAASLRELARTHGRNVRWADAAVRRGENLGATEALRQNVIDVMAPTLPALLDKIDGTKTVPKGIVLNTADAEITNVDMSAWQKILDTLIDPNLIVLFMSIGTLGLIVELWNPGLIFPGTVGAISLILGLFGLQVLPISAAGLLLMLLAFAFFAAEAFVPTHGAITVAGAVCFVLGALLLFEPAGETYEVSLPAVLAIAATLAGLMALVALKIVQVRRAPVVTGSSELLGQVGVVREKLAPTGLVFVRGELWQARTNQGGPLEPGTPVKIERIDDDLVLEVEPST